jgi:acylglycerol lipase
MQPGQGAGCARPGASSSRGRCLARFILPVLLTALIGLAGCAPTVQRTGPALAPPVLGAGHAITADGVRLPLRRWLPEADIEAVVVALHGFTDYSSAFAEVGAKLIDEGIALYAYDQRGFGGAPAPGLWPGTEALVADLRQVAHLVQAAHPGRPCSSWARAWVRP